MKQLTFFPVEKSWMSHHFRYFEVKSADNQIWRYILKGVTSTLEFPIGLSSSFFPTNIDIFVTLKIWSVEMMPLYDATEAKNRDT